MNDQIKSIVIVFSGLLTWILSYFIPVGGGGVSLIFLLTIPFFIVLGSAFGMIYFALVRKIKNTYYRNSIFLTMLLIIIVLTFAWYPYR
ncbi:hypothetical protein [Kordia sp.]|jgi:hypothetical protein|uniref:hypothetical protein n=1 Tax=Kordia sp. TaxID=1965332 RepID=UPI0025BC804F|nr:hypothetical protein [Kordia sp.]MCH2195134.1 hypothetical protein [Kordia sp.]